MFLQSPLPRSNPEDYMDHFVRGARLIKEDQFEEAVYSFEKTVEINPLFSIAYCNLAFLYSLTSMPARSIDCYRKIIKNEGPFSKLGLEAKKDLKKLELLLRKTSDLSLDEHVEQIKLFDKAYACLKAKKHKESIDLFKQVLVKEPNNVLVYGNIGVAYISLGEGKLAVEYFDKALSIDPTCERALTSKKILAEAFKAEEKLQLKQGRKLALNVLSKKLKI